MTEPLLVLELRKKKKSFLIEVQDERGHTILRTPEEEFHFPSQKEAIYWGKVLINA